MVRSNLKGGLKRSWWDSNFFFNTIFVFVLEHFFLTTQLSWPNVSISRSTSDPCEYDPLIKIWTVNCILESTTEAHKKTVFYAYLGEVCSRLEFHKELYIILFWQRCRRVGIFVIRGNVKTVVRESASKIELLCTARSSPCSCDTRITRAVVEWQFKLVGEGNGSLADSVWLDPNLRTLWSDKFVKNTHYIIKRTPNEKEHVPSYIRGLAS